MLRAAAHRVPRGGADEHGERRRRRAQGPEQEEPVSGGAERGEQRHRVELVDLIDGGVHPGCIRLQAGCKAATAGCHTRWRVADVATYMGPPAPPLHTHPGCHPTHPGCHPTHPSCHPTHPGYHPTRPGCHPTRPGCHPTCTLLVVYVPIGVEGEYQERSVVQQAAPRPRRDERRETAVEVGEQQLLAGGARAHGAAGTRGGGCRLHGRMAACAGLHGCVAAWLQGCMVTGLHGYRLQAAVGSEAAPPSRRCDA